MRLKSLLATLVVALWLAGPASAVQLVNPDGSVAQPYQAWADASKVPTANNRIVIADAVARCGYVTMACAQQSPPAIWTSGPASRYTLMHELGHHYDFLMPDWKRRVTRKIIRAEWPWYVTRPHYDSSYSELFAILYAECAMSGRPDEMLVAPRIGEPFFVTRRDYRRICRLIRQPN